MLYDVRDPSFLDLVDEGAALEPIVTGLGITEGTIWHKAGNYLVFSDLVAGIVHRWSEAEGDSVLRRPSNITNGNFIDRRGRILSCEHSSNSVTRLESDGRRVTVLAHSYRGKALNSPNDIVVDSRDRIWFTDPTYGRTSPRVGILRPQDLPFQGVYRLDPDGTLTLVADDYLQPNGLCFSPDEKTLLINDTDRRHIRRYAVNDDGTLSGGEVFAETLGDGEGKPDGMKVDVAGNVYCTGPGGVHAFDPDGRLLGVIRMPEHTRNFCFGGPDGKSLFLAASTTIFRLRMKIAGILPEILPDTHTPS
ncbi:SMP-30/gluconolactonase/LRE family protein [Pseudomonas sp. R2.Fl]|nr:SMP-30/gluconolactonase/LRE family protein [Pseudomonas sp. R2.Fl]